MVKNKHLFKREVTHTPKAAFQKADGHFMQINPDADVLPIWVGGVFLILLLFYTFIYFDNFLGEDSISVFEVILGVFFLLGFLFFIFYYFTKPPKEFIWNREDGLVTFPGFMWRSNITMPIKKVIFIRSAPSAQGLGSHLLQIARPDKSYSLYMASLDCNCYEDLSFFLWYMDKNRPLPPGDAFDEFRQQDYERRKAARFPKPLFPSSFDTPEATPEQQKERKAIGGW